MKSHGITCYCHSTRGREPRRLCTSRATQTARADLGSGFSRFWATVMYSPQNISNVDTYYTTRQLGGEEMQNLGYTPRGKRRGEGALALSARAQCLALGACVDGELPAPSSFRSALSSAADSHEPINTSYPSGLTSLRPRPEHARPSRTFYHLISALLLVSSLTSTTATCSRAARICVYELPYMRVATASTTCSRLIPMLTIIS